MNILNYLSSHDGDIEAAASGQVNSTVSCREPEALLSKLAKCESSLFSWSTGFCASSQLKYAELN